MFSIIKKLIRWSDQYRKRIYTGFVLSFLTGLFIAMPVVVSAMAVQCILSEKTLTVKQILFFTGMMILAVTGRFLCSYYKARIQDTVIYEKCADERIRIGDVLKRVPMGFFSQHSSGELLSAVTSDFSFMEHHAMSMMDTVVSGYITTLVMCLCTLAVDLHLFLIVVTGLVLSTLFLHLMAVFSRRNAPVLKETGDQMTGTVLEYIRGIALVKSYHQQGSSTKRIRDAFRSSSDINIKVEKEYAVCNLLHMLSLKGASVGLVLYSALACMRGQMPVSVMIFVDILSFVIFSTAEGFSSAFHVLIVIDHTLDRLQVLTEAEFIDEQGKTMDPENCEITFDHVSFAYQNTPVINDVSCVFPQNSFTAIVGPSGSGKTTLCNLIARFYDVDQGRILLGGKDLREYRCDSILKQISIVFQNVYLFHDTIENNIRFARPDASAQQVREAAERACCAEFIEALPQGYQTVIQETGSSLSQGEKQRISIARAILKDSPVIILDEATSSVDPENELLIQNAISELVKGKTVIAIAHRLPTIKQADQILVLKEGQLVQQGTHQQLIAQPGVYSDFVHIQQHCLNWNISNLEEVQ